MKQKLLSTVLSMVMITVLTLGGNGAARAADTIISEDGKSLKLSSVSYTTITEGFDWGPAITKVILNLGTSVDTGTLSANTFVVSSERKYNGLNYATMKTEFKDEVAERKVIAAYVSDASGMKAADGTYVTLEMEVGPTLTAGSPFYTDGSGQNKYADTSYIIKLAKDSQLKTSEGLTVSMTATDKSGYTGNTNLIADDFDKTGSFTSGDITLKYASYTPKTASSEKASNPLIIWLHGAGEGGTDPTIALLGNKVVSLATDKIQSCFGETGAYVLVPQCPTMWMDYDGKATYNITVAGSKGKSYYTRALRDLIDEYISSHPEIDRNRIYLGGCSNGGYMTMNMIITYPNLVAAAFPICEAYSAEWLTYGKIARIKNIPIWFTHAKTDPTVMIYKGTMDYTTFSYSLTLDKKGNEIPLDNFSNAAYNRLVAAGAKNVHYSLFNKVVDTSGKYKNPFTGQPYEYYGHLSWIYTLNNECTDVIGGKTVTIFDWLSQQTKK